MVRIYIKKIIVILICFLKTISGVYSQNNIPITMDKKDYEPNYELNKLIEGSAQDDLISYEYYLSICNLVNNYLFNQCDDCYGDKYDDYIGTWQLVDSEDNIRDDYIYELNSKFQILSENYYLKINILHYSSKLKKGVDNQVYFYTEWIGAIRQLKLIDNKLYCYIEDGDKWILDPIHQNGEYYYKKNNY